MSVRAFLDKARSSIDKYEMLVPGNKAVVAVSGGPDSSALLVALGRLRDELDLELHVWHLNHMIRPEAGREADHVVRLAGRLGLPVTTAERNVKAYARAERISLQEAGRAIRYELLAKVSARLGGAKIAVGHNAEDSVETFFINLLRGAGLSGLSGIPPVSGRIVRPLIECERSEILEFLYETQTVYVLDPSNVDKRYLRNRIRAELLPLLKDMRADPVHKITETVSLLRDEEACLDSLSRQESKRLVREEESEVKVDAARLSRLPPALKRRILRLAGEALTKSPGYLDFDSVQSIITRTVNGSGPTNLPGGGRAALSGGELVLTLPRPPFTSQFIQKGGGEVKIDHSLVSVTIASLSTVSLPPPPGLLAIDADKVRWPLEIRRRRAGDWFRPLGMAGKKKLHDFFIDKKVPRRHRDFVPIFADKERVVAVGNMRIDDRVKVSDETERVALLRAPAIIS